MSFVKSIVKSAVVLCVLCGIAFAQSVKPKAAVYIMGNPEGRDALRSAVNTFLIKSGKYQMIAVDAIDVVAQEQRRQMSGAVSDGDIAALGRDAGAQYVCVVQRSELDGISYVATRMVSVQSKVAEMADIVELPYGGKIIDIIQWQIGSMLGMPVGPRPTGAGGSGASTVRPAYTPPPPPIQNANAQVDKNEPLTQGIIAPGGSLADKLIWLQRSADSHNTYVVVVNADERIAPHTFEYRGAINITVAIRGDGANRIVRLQSHGTLFTVNTNVTLILENNITLQGHTGNNGVLVSVNGGTLKMNAGAAISGNSERGVNLNGGVFEMNGGTISGNTTKQNGGGLYIGGGTFTMSGGTISGNKAAYGGGMAMHSSGTFTMRGGVITGNVATESGGGTYVGHEWATFTKTGGTITGYYTDQVNGNVVKDEEGNVIARKGHAMYAHAYGLGTTKRRETTAGPEVKLSIKDSSWE